MLRQIELGRGPQLLLLPPVHELPRLGHPSVLPQLDLHKAEERPLLRDQVHLAKPAAPAGLHQAAPAPAQLLRRQSLSPPAQQPALSPAHRSFKKVRRWMGLGPYRRSIS